MHEYKPLRSLMTYETDVWNFNAKLRSRLLSAEMNFLRTSARFSKLQIVRNEKKREIVNFVNTIL